jgi:hypothetical protein
MKVRQVKREVAAKVPPSATNKNINTANSYNSHPNNNKPNASNPAHTTNKAGSTPIYSKNTNLLTKTQNDSIPFVAFEFPGTLNKLETNIDSTARWFWMNENNWEEYDAKVSNKLEKKYSQKQSNVQIDNDRFVDLKTMSQRRSPPPPPSSLLTLNSKKQIR